MLNTYKRSHTQAQHIVSASARELTFGVCVSFHIGWSNLCLSGTHQNIWKEIKTRNDEINYVFFWCFILLIYTFFFIFGWFCRSVPASSVCSRTQSDGTDWFEWRNIENVRIRGKKCTILIEWRQVKMCCCWEDGKRPPLMTDTDTRTHRALIRSLGWSE